MAPILIATRGSALALAQASMILSQCRNIFPDLEFELKIIKTTGDKLQTASMAQEGQSLPKGLFTKELEVALLEKKADLAVHSLKDLPTELPTGLKLGAVGKRADVRDVLLYRDAAVSSASSRSGFPPGLKIVDLPPGAVVATSSTRRRAQLLALNPRLKSPDIRGNVLTRIQKLADKPEIDATILALAGMTRLKYQIHTSGHLTGENVPPGILATVLDTETMLPCVGQGAIGLEIRQGDKHLEDICQGLNDPETFQCVTAERAFLAAMGGGCQSPVAAHAWVKGSELHMNALSFASGPLRQAKSTRSVDQAAELGQALAEQLKI
ncbi:MAG TPA: hydroxymethylbilane synthase [Patescibacteria group bacterium]|nr:hydroxymethylbilane synthase [Patescibacteria group bacterium]